MKKIALLIGLFVSTYIHAQNSYEGILRDMYDTPLSDATITDPNDGTNTVQSADDGRFQITLARGGRVVIILKGYQTKEIPLSKTTTVIRLMPNETALDEILVTSASREIQKRSEVPGAISMISASDIANTKAFGIDQLVNQVPGVFMSTSLAASNEQHFMAARSPITTKALFLYLEDGLPIRPTSVFNHNALLEMNNTSFGRIEVLKGPASSIYGSEAIGGSFNFITKNPSPNLSGAIDFQTNDLGFSRYELELSEQTSEHFGFYLGGHFAERKDGPISHSDYEKFALTFKTVLDFSPKTQWTTVFDLIDYRSDMTGSLSEDDYTDGNFESDQTFTERDALTFRIRNTLTQRWSAQQKTSFNFIFRDNRMDQNPSYRIRQFRDSDTRALTGFGSGELNTNQFSSYVGLIQHKMDFDFGQSSMIIGGTLDYSPQTYRAETLDVIVDPISGKNTSFRLNEGDYTLNYEADIFNYAGFFQYEVFPIKRLKLTAAIRYDGFKYNYDTIVEDIVAVADSKDTFVNIAPKIGVNYNLNNQIGFYGNYSNGFAPPQVATLYRNRNLVKDIKPSRYDNFELGGYLVLADQLKFDLAIYLLEGNNTLITLRDVDDNFFNTNAGKTRSYGVEYGFSYTPIKGLTLAHNGSYAKHKYINFFDGGVDYSDTDRETAPTILGNTNISYQNTLKNDFTYGLTVSNEFVGHYNTSFEDQVINDDTTTSTATYDGHAVFNAKFNIGYKGVELWVQALNIFDDRYAARASYNRFRNQNSYTIGNPRAFHLGIRYNF